MDFMIQKGYGSGGSINPLKSAAKQVFLTVEGDEFEALDIKSFEIDEYLSRFENMSIGKYTSESLRAYRGRFRKAVESYRSYLADPNWRPEARRSARTEGDPSSKRGAKTQDPSPQGPGDAVPVPGSSLIVYPFPLKSGQMAQLHLPTQLDREDADRLTSFIRALVFQQPAQIEAGPSNEG